MTGYFLQGRCSIPIMGRHYFVTSLSPVELAQKVKCKNGKYLLFTSIWYEDSEWVCLLGVALNNSNGRILDSKFCA